MGGCLIDFQHFTARHFTSLQITTLHFTPQDNTTQHPTSKNMNTPEINPTPTIGRASVEAIELSKALIATEIGDVLTYTDLNAAAKCDVQVRNYVLQTARRIAQRDKSMVFGTIMGIGIKRLSDDEIPDEGISAIKRSRRIAKNGMAKMNCADIAKMSPETKIKAITTKTVLGLFSSSGSRKVRLLAEQKARQSDDLKIGDVATLFKK
jgi:hypothetical protein